ncbi:unnamed protein product, partial [Notodromas monacha]
MRFEKTMGSATGKSGPGGLYQWVSHNLTALKFAPSLATDLGQIARHQIWVLYILESPLHSSAYSEPHSVNWTATYRSDSDIATPHGKWMYFDERVQSQEQNTNLAMNKTKKVAWFVSNCETVNHRLDYVKELSKYIQVDIFGACGSLVCPRNNASTCSVMLRDTYKFYLAFENSNCKDYITEKFFNNALTNNVIPIVMGANKEDYLKAAPLNSFLHINDFESAKELAEKLNEIDKDDDQFNAFFKWQGTWDFVDTNFMCILCGMIHDPQKREKSYMDTKHWWQNNTLCLQRRTKIFFTAVLISTSILGIFRFPSQEMPKETLKYSNSSLNTSFTNFSLISKRPMKVSEISGLPYFFTNGMTKPSQLREPRTFPVYPEEAPQLDRILEQLMFSPASLPLFLQISSKTILLTSGFDWLPSGNTAFNHCPVTKCELRRSHEIPFANSDLVLFANTATSMERTVDYSHQIWVMYILESPHHSSAKFPQESINWTATYRWDSDIVAPYAKWMYFDERVRFSQQAGNMAANKTKKVAWFVSNCGANNNRLEYANELGKYIQVDVYGACGTLECSRSKGEECFEKLKRDYKFYLAFENSNCNDYITEKFFINGLQNNVIPIALGARKEDYAKAAPLNSFLHVDDFESPKALADKLHEIDADDDKFNSFFKWKGTGEFVNTHFMNNVIPIALGARKEDYAKAAPLNSFLHVDDFESPKALADKLHEIDADDDKFNSFFKWKGTGEFVNTHFMCRLCALLHDPYKNAKSYFNTES